LRGNRFCLFAFLWISATAFAQIEMPPKLKTQFAMNQFAKKMRRLIPETGTSKYQRVTYTEMKHFLQRQQNLVKNLEKDPDYISLADQRLPLQTFLFEQIEERPESEQVIASPWDDLLAASELDELPPEKAQAELRTLLQSWPSRASANFFSGFASLLSAEQKKVLAEPDLALRWQTIKNYLADKNIADVRARFDASRYGVSEPDWELSDLDLLVNVIDSSETRILLLLQKLQENGTPWILDETPPALSSLISDSSRVEKLINGLKNRAVRLFTEKSETGKRAEVHRQIVLRETPPYLAIFRGCVGNDCSTSSSTFIPYIPGSRNWWIEDTKGNHLGYVAGAITMVDGKPNLYIHDVTGPGIARTDIALILTGLFQMRENYGADQMTIMSRAFTKENHFPQLVAALKKYGYKFSKSVKQKFTDEKIREEYFKDGGHYDTVSRHARVRKIDPPEALLSDVRATKIPNAVLTVTEPSENPERFWQILTLAARNDDAAYLIDGFGKTKADWVPLIRVINNRRHLPVAEYYRAVEAAFTRAALPFSKNLAKKFDLLFQDGYLNARDAFAEPNLRQAVRYVSDILWRSPLPNDAQPWIRENLDVLENNELMSRNVRTLFDRAEEEDRERVNTLWAAGYRFKNLNLSDEDLSWLAEDFYNVPKLAMWSLEQKLSRLPRPLSAFKIEKSDSEKLTHLLYFEETRYRAAALLFELRGTFNRSDLNRRRMLSFLSPEKDIRLRFPMALAYFRDSRQIHPQDLTAFETVIDGSTDRSVPLALRREARQIFKHLYAEDRRDLERQYRKIHGANFPDWYQEARCEERLAGRGR
jgi:hypothetical protein